MKPPIRSNQVKADLFLALYRMESAGLAASKAFAIVNSEPHAFSQQLKRLENDINKGKSISQSGFNNKLFNALDRDTIHAGESSGRLSQTYQRLHQHYATKARHRKQIKNKLTLPLIMVVLMIFLQPILGLVTGELSAVDYLLLTVGTIIKLALLIYVLVNSGRYLSALGLQSLLHRVQLALPLISNWVFKQDLHRFFSSLGLLLASGLPLSQAIAKAVNTIDNSQLRKKFKPVSLSVENGHSFADSLSLVTDIKPVTIKQIEVGEQSGQLEQTIEHFSEIQADAIAAQASFIADWIPRLIYLFVALMIAYSIISTAKISSI